MSDMPNGSDDDLYTEYGWSCAACGRGESWTTDMAAKLSAIRHVYEQHPDQIRGAAGRAALGRYSPEANGRKLDDWESQL